MQEKKKGGRDKYRRAIKHKKNETAGLISATGFLCPVRGPKTLDSAHFLFIYLGGRGGKGSFLYTKVPLLLEQSERHQKGGKKNALYEPRWERCTTEASPSIQVNPSAHKCFENYMHSSGGLAVQDFSRRMHVQNSIFTTWIFQPWMT